MAISKGLASDIILDRVQRHYTDHAMLKAFLKGGRWYVRITKGFCSADKDLSEFIKEQAKTT